MISGLCVISFRKFFIKYKMCVNFRSFLYLFLKEQHFFKSIICVVLRYQDPYDEIFCVSNIFLSILRPPKINKQLIIILKFMCKINEGNFYSPCAPRFLPNLHLKHPFLCKVKRRKRPHTTVTDMPRTICRSHLQWIA